MTDSSLTLAALATSAVPGLLVHRSGRLVSTDGAFDQALLDTSEGPLVIRVPRTSDAEVRQSAEILGQTALSEGARATLPFTAPKVLGVTRANDTRAVVSTFVDGDRVPVQLIAETGMLLESLAEALAAIHSLPAPIVHHQGLPARQAAEVRAECGRIVERATQTRLLPETLRLRWRALLEATELWGFQPTVVHGGLDEEHVVVRDEQVYGVLGWAGLSLGDPAVDFAWIAEAGRGTLETALALYAKERGAPSTHLLERALLWHELHLAERLLRGVETHDTELVDEATARLAHLVDRLPSLGSAAEPRTPLDEAGARDLLEQTPPVTDLLSDTAAQEALDEDRVFTADSDFPDVPADDDAADGDPQRSDEGGAAR